LTLEIPMGWLTRWFRPWAVPDEPELPPTVVTPIEPDKHVLPLVAGADVRPCPCGCSGVVLCLMFEGGAVAPFRMSQRTADRLADRFMGQAMARAMART
jgi:hypothetical protein